VSGAVEYASTTETNAGPSAGETNAGPSAGPALRTSAPGALLELASVGMAQVEPATGRVVDCNAAFRGLFGVDGSGPTSTFPLLLHEDDRLAAWQGCLRLAGGVADRRPLEARLHRDAEVWVRLDAALPPPGSMVGSLLVLAYDISECKAAELRSHEVADAERRRDELLAVLGHELRNPLAPICNAVHLMGNRPGPLDPEVEWGIGVIARQAEQMRRLVDDMLDLGRFTRGSGELRRVTVNLDEVVLHAVEEVMPLVERRRQVLGVTLPDQALQLDADPVRLAQVFANLLHNAAKFTEEGGDISVLVEREGDRAVVRVRDAGEGISGDRLPHIFDACASSPPAAGRSAGSLGLGLRLVRALVEMHGGEVTALSAGTGRGSEFVVRLPAMPPEEDEAPEHGEGGSVPPYEVTPRRILVVDDCVDLADSLAMVLREEGHEVRVAYDGRTALMLLSRFDADAVVLDVGMPAMDGYELARRIRRGDADRRRLLVALSGYGHKEQRLRGLEAGVDHFLVKPVDLYTLEAVLSAPGVAP
jgi:signal transduction histidine kinase/CheY-like chemotaxis protein